MAIRLRSALALTATLCGGLATLVVAQRGGDAPAPEAAGKPAAGGEQAPGDRARPPAGVAPAAEEEAPSGDDLASTYFGVCDYDADGFVSFKEASASLGADRESFAAYDLDHDGLVSPDEFARRYRKTIELGGAFPPPVPKPKARKAPKRTAEELLDAYDENTDHALDEREVAKALEDYAVHDLAPGVALETVDKDRSKRVEAPELGALLGVLDPDSAPKKGAAKSVLELFGEPKPREEREGMTLLPPQIVGPVPAFERFDIDRDGAISLEDLIQLQRPMQLSIRVHALLASLDRDHDGAIGEVEFRASMAPGGR